MASNTRLKSDESPSRKKARALLSTSFVLALSELGVSHSGAARTLRVDKKTVARWVNMRSPINVEAVLAVPRLGSAFRRALCTIDHVEPAGQAPAAFIAHKHTGSIARRRPSSSIKRGAKSRSPREAR